jgi:hypothetical protein
MARFLSQKIAPELEATAARRNENFTVFRRRAALGSAALERRMNFRNAVSSE